MGKVKARLLAVENKDKTRQIVIEYAHPGKPRRFRIPTSLRSNKKDWDKDQGLSLQDESINKYILDKRDELIAIRDKLQSQGIEPESVLVKSEYYKLENEKKSKSLSSIASEDEKILSEPFLKWFDLHLQSLSNPGSAKNRRIVRNHLEIFDPTVTLEKMDYKWLVQFYDYLAGKVKSANTLSNYFKRLSLSLNTVKHYSRKYRDVKMKVLEIQEDIKLIRCSEKYNDPYGLDFDMFIELLNYKSTDPTKLKVRDHFVLGVAAGGLRMEDYRMLGKDSFRKEQFHSPQGEKELWLVDYYESKNKKRHRDVLVLPYAHEILETCDEDFFPCFRRGDFNPVLKEIAKDLGWTHIVETERYDKNGELSSLEKSKFCDLINSTMMRKTRVTIDEVAEIDESVSKFSTGHTSKARNRYKVKTVSTQVQGNKKHDKIFEQLKAR